MTPEETIRNLINRSSPRKGTGSILSELSEDYVDPNAGTMKARNPGESDSAYQFRMRQQQFELEKAQKYDEWKTKQDAWEKQHGRAYRQQQAQAEYDKAWNENQPGAKEAAQAAQAARNREQQSSIKYEPPTPTGPYTTTVKHEVAAPAKDSNQTGVQQPEQPQPEQPEPPTAPGKGGGTSPSSIYPPTRQASGAGQVGSGLNVSNVQANVQRFLRQSFDPMETRKSFIRESVRACLKNK